MNIKDLKYLVAVAAHKNFGKAAEACFVSQPALSMQIMKLEENLGIQLLERTNKSVRLTEQGEAMVARAKHILTQVDEMKSLANTWKDPFAGELKLGIFPTLAPYLLPHLTPLLKKEYPNITFYLIEEKTATLIEQLKAGQLDAAILAAPVHETLFTHDTLFEEPFLLTIYKQHPLAKNKTIKPSHLDNEKLLLLNEGHCLRDQALTVCHRMKAHENQDFRATSLETLRHMVSAGVGITLMPKLACIPTRDLLYLPFASTAPSRRLALFSRRQTAKHLVLKSLSESIRRLKLFRE